MQCDHVLLLMITGGCFQLWQDSHNDQWWYGKTNKNSEFSYAMPNMCVLHMHIHQLCFSIPLVYSLSQIFFLRIATTISVYFQAKNENSSSTVVSGKDVSSVLEAQPLLLWLSMPLGLHVLFYKGSQWNEAHKLVAAWTRMQWIFLISKCSWVLANIKAATTCRCFQKCEKKIFV